MCHYIRMERSIEMEFWWTKQRIKVLQFSNLYRILRQHDFCSCSLRFKFWGSDLPHPISCCNIGWAGARIDGCFWDRIPCFFKRLCGRLLIVNILYQVADAGSEFFFTTIIESTFISAKWPGGRRSKEHYFEKRCMRHRSAFFWRFKVILGLPRGPSDYCQPVKLLRNIIYTKCRTLLTNTSNSTGNIKQC